MTSIYIASLLIGPWIGILLGLLVIRREQRRRHARTAEWLSTYKPTIIDYGANWNHKDTP